MDGSALLIVPAPANETDPWVEPSGWSRYYSETQFAPIRGQLQTVVTAYVNGDSFNFSRAANQLRETLRALSPSIYPRDQKLRLEYFYNHFEPFYRAIWCYGIALVTLIAAHLRKRGRALQSIGVAVAVLGLPFHAAGIVMRCMLASRPPVPTMAKPPTGFPLPLSSSEATFVLGHRPPVSRLASYPARP